MEPSTVIPEINDKNFNESLLGQISEPSISNNNLDIGNVLPTSVPSNFPQQVSSAVNTTNNNIEQALRNPITLLVKYIDLVSGKELYCTFMKVEKTTNNIENLHETLLQRWSVKVEGNNESSNFVKRENIRKVQLKVADRFNQVTNIDLDNHFLKDYSLQDSDMILVHL